MFDVEPNISLSETNEGVYVLRMKTGDVDGYYVGSSRNVWERITEHCGDEPSWRADAKIGHEICGLECVFIRCAVDDTLGTRNAGGSLVQNEGVVAGALLHRYGEERVYGAGYSDKVSPSNLTPSIEFANAVKDSQYRWMLDYSTGFTKSFDSPYSSVDRCKKRTWNVYHNPPLEI